MKGTLLQLSLCVVTVIRLTSSQSTYDVIQRDNDVDSCAGTEQVLSQLVMEVSQLRKQVQACTGNKDGSDKPGAGAKGKLRNHKGQTTQNTFNSSSESLITTHGM